MMDFHDRWLISLSTTQNQRGWLVEMWQMDRPQIKRTERARHRICHQVRTNVTRVLWLSGTWVKGAEKTGGKAGWPPEGRGRLASGVWSRCSSEGWGDAHDSPGADKLDFMIGEHVWAYCDFQTKQGLNRVDGNKKGVFTRNRQPKAAAHLLRKRWNN